MWAAYEHTRRSTGFNYGEIDGYPYLGDGYAAGKSLWGAVMKVDDHVPENQVLLIGGNAGRWQPFLFAVRG